MLKPYDLFVNILLDIENGIKNNINAAVLSKRYGLSEVHLRRLFSFAFKQTISAYIRSRTLAASLNNLLKTDANILDIAVDYSFEYEQSYIRAFKREFGMTPGDLRKKGNIVKIKPPLHLFDENKLDDGVLFGPDIVMVPQFHIIGKSHHIPFKDSIEMAPRVGRQFWEEERKQIKGVINPYVYIGLTHNINLEEEYSEYTPSVQVENLKKIPHGFSGNTFKTSMCARFRYMGQHHYYDINRKVASRMYDAIKKFTQNEQAKYVLLNDRTYFEMIDLRLYDGTYCQMEWYTPVTEKQ